MSTAAKCWALAYLTILTLAPLHRCLAQSEADSTVSTGRKTVASPSNRTTDFLQRLADARVFSGTVAVQRGGSVVFNRGYGYAVEELYVPMKAEYIFPIGSQSKFFTAVAINQLAKQGFLKVSDLVAKHLDPADFPALGGKPWCPLLHGNETQGCQNVTLETLLTMMSGIFPQDMGSCDDIPAAEDWMPDEWYYKYRVKDLSLSYGDARDSFNNGSDRLVDLLNRIKTLEMPLLFRPNDGWCYEDANYNILGYIVEKYSNMSLGDYIQKNVLNPANLTDTFYWNGAPGTQPNGLRHQMLPIPGYIADFSGAAPPYHYDSSKRYSGWTGELAFSVGAAGAVFSTSADSLKWYSTVLSKPELLRLSKANIESMITPKLDHPLRYSNGTMKASMEEATVFAQGVSTYGSPNSSHGIEFIGAQWAFTVNMRMWINERDVARSDGMAVFMNSTPHIPKGQNCSVVSPVDNGTLNLSNTVCGLTDDESSDLTDYIIGELTTIWNITGVYATPAASPIGGAR